MRQDNFRRRAARSASGGAWQGTVGTVGGDRKERLSDGRKGTESKATMPFWPLQTEMGVETGVARV